MNIHIVSSYDTYDMTSYNMLGYIMKCKYMLFVAVAPLQYWFPVQKETLYASLSHLDILGF